MGNKYFLFYLATIFVLLLTAFNIHSIYQPKKVLGIKNVNTENIFWENFLKDHPNYIPGLLETGQIEKVKKINPNYESKVN